jgi:hypothetical protein
VKPLDKDIRIGFLASLNLDQGDLESNETTEPRVFGLVNTRMPPPLNLGAGQVNDVGEASGPAASSRLEVQQQITC